MVFVDGDGMSPPWSDRYRCRTATVNGSDLE
jgi:hypothetical protein